MKTTELLSPAGNFEKLKAAVLYGADAVYLAGRQFGMRSAADNFSVEELYEAADYVHKRNKKLYLTVNVLPKTDEYPALERFLCSLKDAGLDAMIVADIGVMSLIKRVLPSMEIHVSTQASIVSVESAKAYASLGAKRLVLARELNLEDIRTIRKQVDPSVELEAFVHGSMCVSYSGRCLLSKHLTDRDANHGACTQPCRWNYQIVEEFRENEPLPIEEDEHGTFIMSSKDMCMIEHIPELMESGISSFKIEGRMKSAYYTAVVTNAYRMAMDSYLSDPKGYVFDKRLIQELNSVSHREYCTGFYFDDPMENPQLVSTGGYIREKAYIATSVCADAVPKGASGIPESNEEGTLYAFVQRNKVCKGDTVEMISPGKVGRGFVLHELYSDRMEPIESVPHPGQLFFARVPFPVLEGDIMRSGS